MPTVDMRFAAGRLAIETIAPYYWFLPVSGRWLLTAYTVRLGVGKASLVESRNHPRADSAGSSLLPMRPSPQGAADSLAQRALVFLGNCTVRAVAW